MREIRTLCVMWRAEPCTIAGNGRVARQPSPDVRPAKAGIFCDRRQLLLGGVGSNLRNGGLFWGASAFGATGGFSKDCRRTCQRHSWHNATISFRACCLLCPSCELPQKNILLLKVEQTVLNRAQRLYFHPPPARFRQNPKFYYEKLPRSARWCAACMISAWRATSRASLITCESRLCARNGC